MNRISRGVAPGILLVALLATAGCDFFRGPDARVTRAEKAMAAHDYRAAVIELKNALEDDPGHVQARLRLAEVEFQLGDVVGADKDLRRALELGAPLDPNAELAARIQLSLGQFRELVTQIDGGKSGLADPAAALFRGSALLGLQEYDAARASFARVPQDDAHSVEARAGAGTALAWQGAFDAAITELDALIAAHPDRFEGWVARGATRARAGDVGRADEDLRHATTLLVPEVPATERAKLFAALCEVQLARGDTEAASRTQQQLANVAPEIVATQVLAARIAMARQDYSSATAILQRALGAAPDVVPIRFLLGAALLAQGNLGQAERHLAQVVQRAPENVEARKLLVQVQLRLGRPEAALGVLTTMDRSADPQLDALLGLAHLLQGEQPSGIAYLERAVAGNPKDEQVELELAAAYLRAAQPQKAVELLSRGDRREPDARRTGVLVAALIADGDLRRARTEMEALLAARPNDPATLELAAAFFTQQHEFARARAIAQAASDANPRNVNALLVRAQIEAESGDLKAAAAWLDKALAVAPDNAPAHLALAELAARRGDLDAAARSLEDLRRRDPQSADARLKLAALYMRQRDTRRTQEVVAELTTLAKDQPQVMNALGTLYFDNGRYDEALQRFQSAALQDEANPVYWFNTARAQISLGNSVVARQALEKAEAVQPGWLPAVGTLAMLDVREGHGSEALARVNDLRSRKPRDAEALVLEGDVQMVLHDYGKAADAYQAARALQPGGGLAFKEYKAREAGNLPNPLEPLEAWLRTHADDVAIRVVYAEARRAHGDRNGAVAQYEIVRRSGRATPVVLNNLAWIYYELRDPRAVGIAREAHEAAPGIAAIADTYGWILAETGKAAEAEPILAAAASASDDPSTDFHHAVALLRSGKAEQGRQQLRELLKVSPDFPEAAEARKLLGSAAGG